MSTEQTAAVVPVKPSDLVHVPEAINPLNQLMGLDEDPFYMSWSVKDPEGANLLFKVAQKADVDLTDVSNTTIKVKHLYAAAAEKKDAKTGEITALTRIVLIDDEGKSYACFSQGIRKAIKLMCTCYGLPPWTPPVPVTVKLEKINDGKNWLTLYPAPIAPETTEESNRKKR